jgi:Leucine-rich repeat (LRR) protein
MVGLTEQIVRGKTRVEHLHEVKSLNLWGQDIDDVSVLLKMPGVEVLSLSVNRITSLRAFRHCTRLQELYLRKNMVANINELQYLVPMTELKVRAWRVGPGLVCGQAG